MWFNSNVNPDCVMTPTDVLCTSDVSNIFKEGAVRIPDKWKILPAATGNRHPETDSVYRIIPNF
jgi:hypothetical protein